MTLHWIFFLILPPIYAAIWRYARGEGLWRRWQFYAAMFLVPLLLSGAVVFAAAFLLFVIGLAMPPHNALFSTVTGAAPSRADHWLFNWMQWLAYRLTIGRDIFSKADWYQFGIIYAAVRALWTLLGIFWLWWCVDSLSPLLGLFVFAQGVVYYQAGRLAKRMSAEHIAWTLAEFAMGWLVAVYMLAMLAGAA
jgi:hypothetical protein